MCGISGFCDKQYFGDKEIILKFQNCLNHRGPDFTNYLNYEPLTIISNRLSILDLSDQGNQPMESSTKRYAIVYNGEIYNHKQLQHKYLNDQKFFSKSDTETILELVEKYGVKKTCNLLDGMYAFALLDKSNDKLFLVRDKNGQKPLYYYNNKKSFVFSSEIKIFENYPNFKKKISRKGEQLYFKFGYIHYPYSIYEDVKKLDPKYFLELDIKNNNITLSKLYNDDDIKSIESNFDEVDIEFEKKLEKSVNQHLISDRPLGCFLSGGIDSSLVTYFAKKHSNNKLHTFSIGFENIDYDETQSANKISDLIGTHHHTLIMNNKNFFEIVKDISNYLDEPFADSSLIPTILLCRESKKYVDVVLTGDGSDEYFFGYNRYKYFKKINKIIFSLNIYFRKILKILITMINFNSIKFFFKIIPFKYTKRDYENFYKFIEILDTNSKKDLFLSMISDKNFFIYKNKINFENYNFETVEDISKFDQNIYLAENGMTKIDRASMHFSLETRSPFLSNSLTFLANNLTPEQHTNGFTDLKIIPKNLFKKLMGKYLLQKHKTGFSLPPDLFFNQNVKNIIILKCKKFMLNNSSKVNKKLFNKYVKLYINNKTFNVNLWKIYVYQCWLDHEK